MTIGFLSNTVSEVESSRSAAEVLDENRAEDSYSVMCQQRPEENERERERVCRSALMIIL